MNPWLESWTGLMLDAPGFLLLALVVIATAIVRRDGEPAVRFVPGAFLRRDSDDRPRPLPRSLRQRFRWLPRGLHILGLLALVVAVARPVERVRLPLERQGIDILLCLDISSSMIADDLAPGQSRLAVTKDAAAAFVQNRPDDRIGVVTFARYPDLICPPTLDHTALLGFLAAIELVEEDSDEDATGIGMAIARCAQVLRTSDSSSKVVILLTDGEENVARADTPEEIAPLEAARLCEEVGVRVYTITAGIGRRDASGAWQPLDTSQVRRAASITGGSFFEARDASAVERVYAVIDALERSGFEEPRFELQDRFAAFLLAGLALVLAARLLAATGLEVLP